MCVSEIERESWGMGENKHVWLNQHEGFLDYLYLTSKMANSITHYRQSMRGIIQLITLTHTGAATRKAPSAVSL